MKISTHSLCVLIASVPRGDQRGVGKTLLGNPPYPAASGPLLHLLVLASVMHFFNVWFSSICLQEVSYICNLLLSQFFCPYQFRHRLSFPPSSHSASSCISLCLVISTSAAIMYNPSSHLELVSVFSERFQEQTYNYWYSQLYVAATWRMV